MDAYPSFAAFAAFFGAGTEPQSYANVKKLLDGTELQEIVTLNDRVFLFFVFVVLCSHMEQPDGWYFCDQATSDMKTIRKWMVKEDGNKKQQTEAAEKVKKHLTDLQDGVEKLVAVERATVNISDDDGDDSDGLED